MAITRKTAYTAVNVYPSARDDLRQFAALLSGELGDPVNMSEALSALVAAADLKRTATAVRKARKAAN
jgi:hypothetical protein